MRTVLIVSLFFSCFTLGFDHSLLRAEEQEENADPKEGSPLERKELLKQKRIHKLASLKPEKKSGVEKALLYLEEKGLEQIFKIQYKDFYPKFGSPRQGSGIGGGIRYFRPNISSSPLTLEASAVMTSKDYRLADLQFGRFTQIAPVLFLGPKDFAAPFDFIPEEPGRVGRPKFFLYGDLSYRYYSQEDFYGLGNETTRDTRTDFAYESGEISWVAGNEFAHWFAAAVRLSYLAVNTGPGTDGIFPDIGETFHDTAVPGLFEQPNFLRLSSAVYFNYRDDPFHPHKGGIIGLFFSRHDELGDSRYQFNRYGIDARHYIPLGSEQRTLAIRTVAAIDRADRGSRVPFYFMNTLGGDRTLRGYMPFRFRDTDLLFLSGEYRWEPAPAAELALFYDAGKTFSQRESFDLDDLRTSYGFGIRFKTSKRTILRMDIGRSEENTLLHIRSGVSF